MYQLSLEIHYVNGILLVQIDCKTFLCVFVKKIPYLCQKALKFKFIQVILVSNL